jgi:hypothetical protein
VWRQRAGKEPTINLLNPHLRLYTNYMGYVNRREKSGQVVNHRNWQSRAQEREFPLHVSLRVNRMDDEGEIIR